MWIAYAFDRPVSPERIEDALERVAGHYQETVEYALTRRDSLGPRIGQAIWTDPAPACRWPAWLVRGDTAIASPYPAVGWESVVGEAEPADAAMSLAQALRAEPRRVARLSAPLVVCIQGGEANGLTILNDALGVGRLYEMRFRDGWAWSTRLGALPLFAGEAPAADPRGWAFLAGMGWFMGDSTPIRGARRVEGARAITADRDGRRRVEDSGALASLVAPRDADTEESLEVAANHFVRSAVAAAKLWPNRPHVHLSGGADSRLSAAAMIAEGVDARFVTGNEDVGEWDSVKPLLAAARRELPHQLDEARDQTDSGDLRSRSLALHMAWDGVANSKTACKPKLRPFAAPDAADISGHGGAIAKAFYYGGDSKRRARKVREWTEPAGRLDRIERSARKSHGGAAHDPVYGVVRAESERVFNDGQRLGLDGLLLLDYFYLAERFAHQDPVGCSVRLSSPFTTPAFIRAAFDLTPEQRRGLTFHRWALPRLAPEWRHVPFWKPASGLQPLKRPRLWESSDVEVMEEILGDEAIWGELFDPPHVRRLWAEALGGRGKGNYEQVFTRVAWRVTFEEHLGRIARRARG